MKLEQANLEYQRILYSLLILGVSIFSLATYETVKPQFDIEKIRVTYVLPGDSVFTARVTYWNNDRFETIVDVTGELAYARDGVMNRHSGGIPGRTPMK